MNRASSLVVILASAIFAQPVRSTADELTATKKEEERVQAQARAMVTAVYKGDVDTLLQHTHSKVIDALGGRDQARKTLEKTLMRFAAIGIKVEKFEHPSRPIFLKGSDNEFVIVPTKMIVAAGEKRVESLNFQFGARRIGSSDWGYIEGSRINRDNVLKLFPDFPKEYEFPPTYRKLTE